jgi:hypothetical protein
MWAFRKQAGGIKESSPIGGPKVSTPLPLAGPLDLSSCKKFNRISTASCTIQDTCSRAKRQAVFSDHGPFTSFCGLRKCREQLICPVESHCLADEDPAEYRLPEGEGKEL